MAEHTGIRVEYETVRAHLKAAGMVLSHPQHTIASPGPEYALKKRRSKKPAAVSNRESASTLRRGVRPELDADAEGHVESQGAAGDDPDPRPAYPKRYGIGALDYHTGETVVLIRRGKRRREVAELLEALLEKHPSGTVYVAWDNSNTHEDEEVEVGGRGGLLREAAGRLVATLPAHTYGPWLNLIEMLWRRFRREVSHCELYPSIKALVAAAYDFFERYDRRPREVLSVLDSGPAEIT